MASPIRCSTSSFARVLARISAASLCALAIASTGCTSASEKSSAAAKPTVAPPTVAQPAATALSGPIAAHKPRVASAPAVTASDWQGIVSSRIAAGEYAVRSSGSKLRAFNRAHNLELSFGARGLAITAPAQTQGELALRTRSIARGGERVAATETHFALGACRRDGALDELGDCLKRAEQAQPKWVEWWENGPEGLEQGFDLAAPPVAHAAGEPLRVEIEIDATRIAIDEDGQGATIEAGAQRFRYAKLLVTDASDNVLAARMVAARGGLAIEVDDARAQYPIRIDPLLTTTAWTREVNQADASFGISVASAGDVNGDGYGDVIVGAHTFDAGEADEGRAYLYYGGASGLSTTAAWNAESNQATAYFGRSVAGAGDVNGDGYGDVIVGAYLFDRGQADEGCAFLYLGSSAGLPAAASAIFESNQAGARFGFPVRSAGDVNNDGLGDIVVGAPLFDNGQTNEGRVFVFHGRSGTVPSATPSWMAESDQASSEYGYAVDSAGDVNGDGVSDLVVGAHDYDAGETDEGRIFVYYGRTSLGLNASAGFTAESNQASSHFGFSVAGAGDVTADGIGDLIVGETHWDGGQTNEGRVSIYYGSTAGLSSSSPVWRLEGDQTSALFGYAVASAGDVNGDGVGDVIASAQLYNNGSTDEGRAYVFAGRPSFGPSGAPIWIAEGDQTDARFGTSVACAGDVNGDGFSDVIVGAHLFNNGETDEGRAMLYLGGSTGASQGVGWRGEGNQSSAIYGNSVASAGDVNADGYDDIIVGAWWYETSSLYAGKAFVYLGTAGGLSPDAQWTHEGQEYWQYGISVASAGDVNCDGYGDVIVGADQYDEGDVHQGAAFVYLGGPTGITENVVYTFPSDHESSHYGISVASAGDVNGDGCGDIIVGAPGVKSNSGRVDVFKGSVWGPELEPSWSMEPSALGVSFGSSVASAGDVNGDGVGDVIIGSLTYSAGQLNEGAVFVYHGRQDVGLETTPAWTSQQNVAGAGYGRSVASAGDVNGDGVGDVIIGAADYTNGQSKEGKAYVFHGHRNTGLSTTADWSSERNFVGGFFGYPVSSAGDVNGDGYGDVVIGSPIWVNPGVAGAAYMHFGSASGLATAAGWSTRGVQPDDQLGFSVASAGDINGDGFGDVLIGVPGASLGATTEGAAYVYLGNSDYGNLALPINAVARRPGTTMRIAPAMNSGSPFGFDVTMLSARGPMGRTRVRMELEVKPYGTNFNGIGLIKTPTWTSTAAAGTQITRYVTKAEAGGTTRVHWRARLLYDPSRGPWYQRSHWMYGGRQGDANGFHVRLQ